MMTQDEIERLSDEDLVAEFATEIDGETRRIGSDPPSQANELEAEILKRMKRVQP